MYVIYDKETTRYLTDPRKLTLMAKKTYATERSAKAALTRLVRIYADRAADGDRFNRTEAIDRNDYAIAEYNDFKQNIEKTRTTKNMLNPNGKAIEISVNTPNCCDPGSETYHSM